MFKYILLALLLVNVSGSFCQNLPSLTRQQMYADFDTLIKTLIEVSPQVPVRKKVTGLDLEAELIKLRKRIDQIESTIDFGVLVRTALILCQDGHTGLLWKGYSQTLEEYQEEGASKEAVQVLPVYDSILRSSTGKPFNLRLKYLKGEYYTIGQFAYNGQKFPAGMKLLRCNGMDIHDYVQGLLGNVQMMRWDFKNGRYFAENFIRGYHLKKQDSLTLAFKDQNGRLISSSFLMSDTLNYGADRDKLAGNPWSDTLKTVEYFPAEQILYIRVPKMDLTYLGYYKDMIRQKGQDKPVKKVIIDIRNNPGGADNVWTTILKNLIATPITYKNVLLSNNSATIRSRLLDPKKELIPYVAAFLNDYEYVSYYTGENTLAPDSSTIGYRGKIYVIQNENIYSSAGSFTAVAVLAEDLLTVGSPTGRLLGRGINPIVFELPHSKILYRVEPVIDFMNVKDAEDVFHDKVEIPVELSVDQYMDRILSGKMLYSKDYLFNYDPVFRKILSLK